MEFDHAITEVTARQDGQPYPARLVTTTPRIAAESKINLTAIPPYHHEHVTRQAKALNEADICHQLYGNIRQQLFEITNEVAFLHGPGPLFDRLKALTNSIPT